MKSGLISTESWVWKEALVFLLVSIGDMAFHRDPLLLALKINPYAPVTIRKVCLDLSPSLTL